MIILLSVSECVEGGVCVCGRERELTSVHTEVTGVLVEGLQGGDIRRSLHYLIHPLDGSHHLVPLSLSEDRWALVLWDLT